MVKTFLAKEEIKYDGSQIESLWAYKIFNMQGDSIVAFKGPCDIPFANMVDLEDVKAKSEIFSHNMLHFIAEHFELDLERAILKQRLLSSIVKDELELRIKKQLRRTGDDIFDGDAKLTISIATLTPVSSKIHFAINIDSEGTPVKTRGLQDYDINPDAFGSAVLTKYVEELELVQSAKCKVRGVK